MSFAWEKAGTFRRPEEAEEWCRRQGIARNDRIITQTDNGFDLDVRSSAMDSEDRSKRPW